jgi:hypothetical protein
MRTFTKEYISVIELVSFLFLKTITGTIWGANVNQRKSIFNKRKVEPAIYRDTIDNVLDTERNGFIIVLVTSFN